MIFYILDFLGSREVNTTLDTLVKLCTVIGLIVAIITIRIYKGNLNAVLQQLREMKIQRTHSQEPDLFIEPMKLFVDYSDEDIIFDAAWIDQEIEYNQSNLLPITVTNIGNGVAKYVGISAFFEREFLMEVEDYDKDKIFKIRTLETDYGIDFFQYEYGKQNKKQSMNNFDMDQTKNHSFNYLRPEQSVYFDLDKNFMQILNLSLFLTSKINQDKENLIPRVKVILSYFDSFDNKYEKEVDVYIGTSQIKYNFDSFNRFSVSFDLNGLNRLPKKQIINNDN